VSDNKNPGRGQAGKGRTARMGQESSTPIDESTPCKTLPSRTLEGLAKYINDGHVKKIVVMVSYKHVLDDCLDQH